MKITSITEERITFDNGNYIDYYHDTDCCEWNYADFDQLDDLGRYYDFDNDITFETLEEQGIMFGDHRRKFFIPCYTEQTGYYTGDLNVFYRSRDGEILNDAYISDCKLIDG